MPTQQLTSGAERQSKSIAIRSKIRYTRIKARIFCPFIVSPTFLLIGDGEKLYRKWFHIIDKSLQLLYTAGSESLVVPFENCDRKASFTYLTNTEIDSKVRTFVRIKKSMVLCFINCPCQFSVDDGFSNSLFRCIFLTRAMIIQCTGLAWVSRISMRQTMRKVIVPAFNSWPQTSRRTPQP